MSSPEEFSGGSPFGPGSLADLMRNLARYFSSQGPLNWEIARQMAVWAATGGEPEPNPEPTSRVSLEALVRVAELQVAEATGLDVAPGGALSVTTVTKTDWALRTLDHWKPFLEKLAEKMAPALSSGGDDEEGLPGAGGSGIPGWDASAAGGQGAGDPLGRLFSQLPQVIGPFLFGLQSGSMVGQLASRAMGQYDLPMPRPAGNSLLVVSSTLDAFASDWSLWEDDVRMWVCLREATANAVLGRPHIRSRLEKLIFEYIDAFVPDAGSFESRLAGIDPMDMGALQEAFGDPETLLGEMQTDAQRRIQVPLTTLLSVVVGYVDHVMDSVGRRLIGSYGPITEALRRRRLEESSGNRILGKLCGVALDAGAYDQGRQFVDGVLERAGESGLQRLWRSEREIPTPAELTAPGLWLARIDLPPDPPEGG
jgi:putative hydrolase